MRSLSHPLVGLLAATTIVLGPVSLTAEEIDIYERPLQAERSRSFDAKHYRIELRFDEDTRSFWGKTSLTFSPLRDGLASLALDAETFVVEAVQGIGEKLVSGQVQPERWRVYRTGLGSSEVHLDGAAGQAPVLDIGRAEAIAGDCNLANGGIVEEVGTQPSHPMEMLDSTMTAWNKSASP